MRVSYNWLKRWVDAPWSAGEAAERFTAAGLEVDSVEPVGGLEGVVVGEIVSVEPHPDADRLSVCRVEHGAGEPATIVCGAPNARTGLKAPLARIGARLPGGMEIKAARLRGVASEGMLCSEPELELGEDASGLMALPADATPGQPLDELLGLPDSVLTFDLTPNRADCLSVRGLARELSALSEAPLCAPAMEPVAEAVERRFPIELAAPADCPRYVGRVIEGIDASARSPLWMVEALRRSGLRSLGPTVDVTNYVLLELGQPMHAFDLDRLAGGIRVRRAEAGERIRLLDGREVGLDADMLLIADHEKPVALAGIMGGLDTAVTASTTSILLESAWFDPAVIVGRGRRLGLATESAHRFERGVDPALQRLAVERSTALLLEIAGGRPGPVLDVTDPRHRPDNPPVPLRLDRVNGLLGTQLTGTEVGGLLGRLGMEVKGGDPDFEVRGPSARRDLALEVDLIEEVARLVGYDRLPARAPGGRLEACLRSETRVGQGEISFRLQARGFQEIMAWSFVAADELARLEMEAGAQPLANPLSQELAVLRTSLLPGLLKAAAANRRRQRERVRLFEIGHVFRNSDSGLIEREKLGLAMLGDALPESWSSSRRALDFFDLKGEIEQLLAGAGHPRERVRFEPAPAPWLHPGQAAELRLGEDPAGWLGQLHPRHARALGLGERVFVAELDLQTVCIRPLPVYHGLARYPSVRRDLALVVPESLEVARLIDTARDEAGQLLENWVVFDQYRGEEIEAGCKSVAIGLILRDVSRTLRDQEVDALIAAIVDRLANEHEARLRE